MDLSLGHLGIEVVSIYNRFPLRKRARKREKQKWQTRDPLNTNVMSIPMEAKFIRRNGNESSRYHDYRHCWTDSEEHYVVGLLLENALTMCQ